MAVAARRDEEDDDQKECPSCGNTNPRLSQHCMQCGSPLL